MKLPASTVKTACTLAAASCLWAAGSSAHAAVVQAQFTPKGGNAWAAAFTVAATGPQVIESFTIYLDAAWARNVVVQSSPLQWDTLAVQADPVLASDAFVDALLLGPDGIGAAAPLAGFEISFDWLGAVAPAALRFTVNDPATFAVLETGSTVSAVTATVPEPAVWTLFALSAGLAVAFARSPRH